MNTEFKALHEKLTNEQPRLDKLDSYWTGSQPAAFLSPKSKEALGSRLSTLTVNYPRLSVTSLADRLDLTGFRINGSDTADMDLWNLWRRNGMVEGSAEVVKDALIYGRGYVLVWIGPRGVQVTVESPRQMTALRDPATREIRVALKRWIDGDYGYATVYGPDEIVTYKTKVKVTDWGNVSDGAWSQHGKPVPNPLGVPPVGMIINRDRLLDFDGVSEMTGIMDLSDALSKIMADAMVTSEHYARPRRWATGMEIIEDEEGNPIDPFSDDAKRVWTSEAPETQFGQFSQASLSSYTDLTQVLTAQIGAMKGLPPHYMGIHGDQPASAEARRSAESSLVQHANNAIRMFGADFAWIVSLMIAVRDGVDPYSVDVTTVWANPETRTPAQAADAAAKLAGIGVPLETLLSDELGYEPTRIATIMAKRRQEALEKSSTDLGGLVA